MSVRDRLPCDDLETDGDGHTATSNRKCAFPEDKMLCQERIDSGIGSMSFKSSDSVISEIRSQLSVCTAGHTDNAEKCDSVSASCEEVDNLSHKLKDSTLVDSDDDEGISSFDPDSVVVVKKCTKVTDRITDEALEVYGRDLDGDTLLHISIIQGEDMLTREFIRLAPWNNWLDIYNEKLRQTPLHLAAHVNNSYIARALMVGGADVEMCDHNGDTPLHIACRKGHMAVVGALLKPVAPAETQHVEYEYALRRIPQNLELRNSDGYTCAHVAAENGHVEILQVLISRGADLNAGDGKSGASVLHFAAMNNDVNLTKFLLRQKEIDIEKEMYNGTTPMAVAKGRKNAQIVELLSEAGAQFSDVDYYSSDEEN